MARACPDHEPDLVDFINRHIGFPNPVWSLKPRSGVRRFALELLFQLEEVRPIYFLCQVRAQGAVRFAL